MVRSGSSATYTVALMLSNGLRISNPTPTIWSSDNVTVATIDENGHLTAHRHGAVTVTATHEGREARLPVLVPVNNDNPGGANVVVSYRPDPVSGSPAPCLGSSLPGTPTWTFTALTSETQGVGFTLKSETLYLYDEEGREIFRDSGPEEDYLSPKSAVSTEVCISLLGRPSGFLLVLFHGFDDRGTALVFASPRLRLLPIDR